MVKVGCHDCKGCSACCQDMGQSIWLDPYDIYQMCNGLQRTFEDLLNKEVELHVEDGLILPNIRMQVDMSDGIEKCGFLDASGRCSIHAYRPGFCRLFPLGRDYSEEDLRYFLLEDACPMAGKTKMKINKWLNVPGIKEYELFLKKWHRLTKGLRQLYLDNSDNEGIIKTINMQFLQIFYMTPYDFDDFFLQFEARLSTMKSYMNQLGIPY